MPTTTTISPDQAIAEFKEFARDHGLILKGDPIADGKFHRVAVEGQRDKTKRSGSYRLHVDEFPAGHIWNFKQGIDAGWSASGGTQELSLEERRARDERLEAEQEAATQERLTREHEVSEIATHMWLTAERVDAHPYLEKKGVLAPDARVDKEGRLLVPMHDVDGGIWSLQRIDAEGNKRYAARGRKQGMHCLLGAFDPSKPLILTEGVATGMTVRQATGETVAVCFDSANLLPVARAYRDRFPDLAIVVAADNDHHLPLKQTATGRFLTNVGIEKANEVATQEGASVVYPKFSSGDPGTDWNDYAKTEGLQAARDAIAPVCVRAVQMKAFFKEREPSLSSQKFTEEEAARPAQLEAIERVNALGGDLEEKQRRLTTAFKGMMAREAGDQAMCWKLAADATVQYFVNPPKIEKHVPGESLSTEKEVSDPVIEQDEAAVEPEPIQFEEGVRLEDLSTDITPEPPAPLERLDVAAVKSLLSERKDLCDKDLSGLDLSNLVFDGVNLSGSSLANTTNTNTVYQNCFALATDFSGARFKNAVIQGNNAAASLWNGATLEDTSLGAGNVFAHAQMRRMVVKSGRTEEPRQKPVDVPPPSQAEQRIQKRQESDGISLLDSLRADVSRIAQSSAIQKLKSFVTGARTPEQQEKIRANYEASRKDALLACGWDGADGSLSQTRAEAIVRSNFVRLARSGSFNAFEVEEGVKLFTEIAAQNATIDRVPVRAQVVENDFSHADLTGARMVGVDVRKNTFHKTILKGALIDGLDLNEQELPVCQQLEVDAKKDIARDGAIARLGLADDQVRPADRARVIGILDNEAQKILATSLNSPDQTVSAADAYKQAAEHVISTEQARAAQEARHTNVRESRSRGAR